MPPDDPSDLEPDDLPGLDEADSSDLVEADLPGFDDDDSPGPDDVPSPGEPEAPPDKADPPEQPEGDPLDQVDEAIHKWDRDTDTVEAREAELEEARNDARRRLNEVDSDLNDLAPQSQQGRRLVAQAYEAIDEARAVIRKADDLESFKLVEDAITWARHEVEATAVDIPKKVVPRFYFPFKIRLIVGGFGVIGLVLLGFFFFGGSDDAADEATALPSVAPVEATTAVSTEPVVVNTEAPAVALDAPVVADVAAAAFPGLWLFTATKTADLVLIPDTMDSGEIGIQLDLYVMVTETCAGDVCTYTSVVERLERFAPLIGTIPEATWVIDGTEWSLDAKWQTTPDCVQDHHFTYQFTVTSTQQIGSRTVPAAFTGTWVQASRSDCNGGWEHVAEWSVVGTAVSG